MREKKSNDYNPPIAKEEKLICRKQLQTRFEVV